MYKQQCWQGVHGKYICLYNIFNTTLQAIRTERRNHVIVENAHIIPTYVHACYFSSNIIYEKHFYGLHT
jgi:hypothetical protein